MVSSVIATIFVPMVLFTMADGSELHAVGDNYPTYDACMVQAEADAKVMEREIESIENTLAHPVIAKVSIVCEQFPSEEIPEHSGYIPLEEYYEAR